METAGSNSGGGGENVLSNTSKRLPHLESGRDDRMGQSSSGLEGGGFWVNLSLLPCDEKAINACLPAHRGFSWTSVLIHEAVATAT